MLRRWGAFLYLVVGYVVSVVQKCYASFSLRGDYLDTLR